MTTARPTPASPPTVLVYHARDRVRQFVRLAFPRRRARMLFVRTAGEAAELLRTALIDAAIVDVGTMTDDSARAIALAREFPSVAFFGIAPLRGADAPAVAQISAEGFVDLLVDGIDDVVAREMVLAAAFTTRFGAALREPPATLGLATPLQLAAWRAVVAHAGRPVRTSELAARLGVTREHLSRTFATRGAPNLKRVIDLVRLLAAAELAKNPGHDLRDVAHVLEFASPSHLGSTAQRVVGSKPTSLARLRTVDLLDRFVGHGRSRGRSGNRESGVGNGD